MITCCFTYRNRQILIIFGHPRAQAMAIRTPMISALTLRGMPEFIRAELGTRALRLAYYQSGLPVGVTDIEDAYIPETALTKFIASAARNSGDRHLGLRLAPHLSVASYGTWGRYVLEAETLARSLARFEEVIGLHASYRSWNVSASGDLIWIRYQFQVNKRIKEYANLAYCGVGVLTNIVRQYAGPDWNPAAVELDIDEPRSFSDLEDAFPCEHHFNANTIGIAFRRDQLSARRLSEPATTPISLADTLRSRAPRSPQTLTEAVDEIIRVQLCNRQVSMDAAALALDMGTRRLRRILERDGHSFRQRTQAIRVRMAKEKIAGTSMSISEISEDLGYADISLFSRFFSREVGLSPSSYRKGLRPR
jgi:AraC-like DNA-binding protein